MIYGFINESSLTFQHLRTSGASSELQIIVKMTESPQSTLQGGKTYTLTYTSTESTTMKLITTISPYFKLSEKINQATENARSRNISQQGKYMPKLFTSPRIISKT